MTSGGPSARLRRLERSVETVTTRVPLQHTECPWSGRVTPDDLQKEVAPSTGLATGRGHVAEDLVVGVLRPAEHPAKKGFDMTRVPASARIITAPRRGVSSRGCWSFGGVLVYAGIPKRPSGEGDGMT